MSGISLEIGHQPFPSLVHHALESLPEDSRARVETTLKRLREAGQAALTFAWDDRPVSDLNSLLPLFRENSRKFFESIRRLQPTAPWPQALDQLWQDTHDAFRFEMEPHLYACRALMGEGRYRAPRSADYTNLDPNRAVALDIALASPRFNTHGVADLAEANPYKHLIELYAMRPANLVWGRNVLHTHFRVDLSGKVGLPGQQFDNTAYTCLPASYDRLPREVTHYFTGWNNCSDQRPIGS